ncbi:MAG TPA: 50S ribosomal protein L29 [Candidatus Microsaccharimonas sp.]|jgi:ribosomal protein L29
MADKKATKAVEVKTSANLVEDLVKLQLEHLESRKSHKQGELVNPHVLTVQRKNIARAHTAIAAATKAESSTNLSAKVEEK